MAMEDGSFRAVKQEPSQTSPVPFVPNLGACSNDGEAEEARDSNNGGDIISSMPDDILHHILSFIPTSSTITTSVLSKRWRHVWSESPSLYFQMTVQKIINQTLISYKAPKIKSFHILITRDQTVPQIDSWIEFAMSRNVQKLFLTIGHKTYNFQDFFYLSSSLTQLSLELCFEDMIPKCKVSWKSLRNLSLTFCNLSDESIANILAGSPKLESLTLSFCGLFERLDLSKSLNLIRLELDCNHRATGPTEIIAPHIHYLKLRHAHTPRTLLDVSSLIQADVNIIIRTRDPLKELEMLEKLRNVESLTVGAAVLQLLSLAEVRGVPFPTLKVQTLIVKTRGYQPVIPGIARLLQNSPGLKKLTVHTTHGNPTMDEDLDCYLDSQGLNLLDHLCWRSKYNAREVYSMLRSQNAILFIKFVLRNAETLEKVVVRLENIYFDYDAKLFEEQVEMVRKLSHDNNVSIELKQSR